MGDADVPHLSEEEYRAEVTEMAGTLAQIALARYDNGLHPSFEQTTLELAAEVVFPHEWFHKYELGAADLGAVIGYGTVNPGRFNDLDVVYGVEDLGEELRRLATIQFEADVIGAALDSHEAGGGRQ